MDLNELAAELEAVSVRYAQRNGIERDEAWFLLKLQEEVGELTQSYLMRAGQARIKGRSPEELEQEFRGELADVLGHVLLIAHRHGVDLQEAVERKWLRWRT